MRGPFGKRQCPLATSATSSIPLDISTGMLWWTPGAEHTKDTTNATPSDGGHQKRCIIWILCQLLEELGVNGLEAANGWVPGSSTSMRLSFPMTP